MKTDQNAIRLPFDLDRFAPAAADYLINDLWPEHVDEIRADTAMVRRMEESAGGLVQTLVFGGLPFTRATMTIRGEGEKPPKRPRLFLDLDGVLADFDGGFPRIFGWDHNDRPEREMWDAIGTRPNFFDELEPFPGARAFFSIVRPLVSGILTSATSTYYATAARAKHAWVRRHLCADVLVLPVSAGLHKPAFIQDRGDVLVDDWGKNCAAWAAAGGNAIKHEPGDFVSTLNALQGVFGSVRSWAWMAAQ